MNPEQEIRARAIYAAVKAIETADETNKDVLKRADLFATYIRLGMEGVEGMLKEKAK